MVNTEKIINSFYLQDELNPNVWVLPKERYMGDTEGQKPKLKPEIKSRLLKIAEIFIDYIDVDFFVQDIILVGSLVGYNWSEFSDFDLHIVYDFKDAGEDRELYEELFRLKKTVFNAAHDILIKGFEVEVYVQDLNEKNESSGVFSLMNNEWIKFPKREDFKVDQKKITQKAEQWMDIIDSALEEAKEKSLSDAIKYVKKYREKLRKYRTCGLKKEGEYSYENLVFKFLRRNGYIQKLENFKNNITDKKLSLEQENFE
jgi:hypothetical protein